MAAAGSDCDDADPLVFPGSPFFADADADGFGDGTDLSTPSTCGPAAGSVTNSDDCDDSDALVFPGAAYFSDVDGDGFGTTALTVTPNECGIPDGFNTQAGDCNDNDALSFPGNPEVGGNDSRRRLRWLQGLLAG